MAALDCVVIAGGRPSPEDPLYVYTKGKPKALIDIAGRAMVEWVVDALQSTPFIKQIAIVGIDPGAGVQFRQPVHFLPDQGSMVANGQAGIKWAMRLNPEPRHLIFCSADIPAITGDVIRNLINLCLPLDYDIYYFFVTKKVMENRFPSSRRTFARFKHQQLAGGDIIIAKVTSIERYQYLLNTMEESRKYPWKLARVVGPITLARYLFRRLSLEEVENVATSMLKQPAKIKLSPFAEIAMDADRPQQVELLRADLTSTHSSH